MPSASDLALRTRLDRLTTHPTMKHVWRELGKAPIKSSLPINREEFLTGFLIGALGTGMVFKRLPLSSIKEHRQKLRTLQRLASDLLDNLGRPYPLKRETGWSSLNEGVRVLREHPLLSSTEESTKKIYAELLNLQRTAIAAGAIQLKGDPTTPVPFASDRLMFDAPVLFQLLLVSLHTLNELINYTLHLPRSAPRRLDDSTRLNAYLGYLDWYLDYQLESPRKHYLGVLATTGNVALDPKPPLNAQKVTVRLKAWRRRETDDIADTTLPTITPA